MDAIAQIKSQDLKKHMENQGFEFTKNLTLCPFHNDSVPSLAVNNKNGFYVWYCHSCEEGGSIIDFVMKEEELSKGEAIKKLKEHFHIEDDKPKIVKKYPYKKEGKIQYIINRFKPKDFRADRKMKGIERIPYHYDDVKKASEIWICEGEKDADNVCKLGLTGTTFPFGKGHWRPEFSKYFKGKTVYVCLDKGAEKEAEKRAKDLIKTVRLVKIIELPELTREGQDISDWIEMHDSKIDEELRERLEGIAERTPVYEKDDISMEPLKDKNKTEPHLTDMGNAQRFGTQYHKTTKFCHPWGKWLNYAGTHWQKDESGEVECKAREVVKQMYKEASEIESKAEREELAKFAIKCESNQKIKAMLSLAQSEPGIPILPKNMDSDPWLLNVKNGTIDLKTGKLEPHRKENFITKLAPVEFDPEAKCPLFKKFLIEIMDGQKELTEFLQKALGYSLTGSIQEHAFFILHGRGANGKTTLLNLILYVLGDYAQRTPVETLLLRRTTGIPNDVARLKGARFVAAMEAEQNRRLAESLVKALTGGDRLIARFLFGEFFEFNPQFKLFLGTNHKPVIRGVDHAMWRRIKLIPFEVIIPDEKQDKNLFDKLKEEAPGILTWLLEGCLMWQEEGLEAPEEVKQATLEYQTESDVIGQFFNDCVAEDKYSKVKSSELYTYYKGWCEDNGEEVMSQTAFGRTLIERGLKKEKLRTGIHYCGLKLKG